MLIKFGVKAPIVKEYKDMLVALEYLYASTHDYFGRDSEKATRSFQADHGLVVDGIIGPITSAAIREEYAALNKPTAIIPVIPVLLTGSMVLKYMSNSPIVKQYKDVLVALGYLTKSTHSYFGRDTEKAVYTFQCEHELVLDGIINQNTSAAIISAFKTYIKTNYGTQIIKHLDPTKYPYISSDILSAINMSLQDETPVRIELVKLDLKWIMPHGLYVFGYNLYTSDLVPMPITKDGIRKQASRYPGYYTNGRLEYQLNYINECAEKGIYLSGCDCSGKEVGLYRKLGIFPPTWDCKAHWLYHSYCSGISESSLRPGDLLFKRNSSGRITHVAMYLGSGYVSEAVGTAYGIQITDNINHIVRDNMKNVLVKHSRFNVFGRPNFIA